MPLGMKFSSKFERVNRRELTPEEQGRVVVALKRLLDERFDGNQSKMCAEIPAFSQSYVSRILRGEARAGWSFARHLARAWGVGPEELVAGAKSLNKPVGPVFSDVPNWQAARDEAVRQQPQLEAVIDRLATSGLPIPLPEISVDRLLDLAFVWSRIWSQTKQR